MICGLEYDQCVPAYSVVVVAAGAATIEVIVVIIVADVEIHYVGGNERRVQNEDYMICSVAEEQVKAAKVEGRSRSREGSEFGENDSRRCGSLCAWFDLLQFSN